ncbi:cytochrome P450 6B5-like [Bombyx mandarina]|uniref:unspecific monooxygenase n=1 Tax=Bombyx mandarina TaxID=7092 RepID=A0A6J2KD62_BOMMA|nr:cytochrome P450 6B5-like [Bombyx mandarina]
MLLLLFISFTLLLIFFWKQNNYWKSRNVKQVTGTLFKFTFGSRSLPEYYKEIYDKHNESQIGIYLGRRPAIILKDLRDIQAVLAGDFQSFHSRGIILNEKETLADSILFIDDLPRWKILRQKLSPAFSSLRLKTMFEGIERSARDFVEFIENSGNDQGLEEMPFNAIYKYTTGSIGAAVFGVDVDQNTLDTPVLNITRKALEPTLKSIMTFFLAGTFPRLIKWLDMMNFDNYETSFIDAVKKVLENRRAGEKQYDFIDVCLELQNHEVLRDLVTGYEIVPTDELLAAQAFFFFVAGADTTANVMHFTLLELSSNPSVLKKLHAEIDEVFQDEKKSLNFEDMDKFKYLEMVVNETMRKYPPIGLLQRICTKETNLPSNNLRISKDTIAVVPVLALHRDERFYPKSDAFDPQRFAPENFNEINKFSFLPFGEGNRVCIGAKFARLQLRAGLAWLLRKYTLVPQDYKPVKFERSPFAVRDSKAKYRLINRTN